MRLPLATDESGRVGVRYAAAETVRTLALAALPPLLREAAAPGQPLDLQVAAVRAAARRLDPGISLAPAPGLRPHPPAPVVTPAVPEPLAAAVDGLVRAAGSGALATLRAALRQPAGRAALVYALPRLPPAALAAVEDLPVRGALATALLGRLADPAPAVRRAVLSAVPRGLADDRQDELLAVALWLSRHDPDPGVRRLALEVLAAGRTGAGVQARLVRALDDPDPEVRAAAIPLALRRAAGPARERLLARLPTEAPGVRMESFAALLRLPGPALPVALVLDGLADVRPRPAAAAPVPARSRPVPAAYRTVQEAVLSALEARAGVRHQGPPARRAERWRDDLLRYGWTLPERPE